MYAGKERTNKRMKRSLIVLACACLALTSARAATILDVGLGSSLVVGEVIPQLQNAGGQETRDLLMLNTVVNMYNGTTPVAAPYVISGNVFPKPLPPATTTGDVITPATGIDYALDGNVTITIGSGYQYLIAAYDGKNSGAVVWDIGGLAAGTTIEIPRYAVPNAGLTDLLNGADGQQYGITTWSLFSPGTNVPDGGTTVLLLGAAVSGVGLVRRKLS